MQGLPVSYPNKYCDQRPYTIEQEMQFLTGFLLHNRPADLYGIIKLLHVLVQELEMEIISNCIIDETLPSLVLALHALDF